MRLAPMRGRTVKRHHIKKTFANKNIPKQNRFRNKLSLYKLKQRKNLVVLVGD